MGHIDDPEADASEELLQQLQQIDGTTERAGRRPGLFHGLVATWKSLKLKAALGHIGLLVSLSIYCAVGGLVSEVEKGKTLRFVGNRKIKLLLVTSFSF